MIHACASPTCGAYRAARVTIVTHCPQCYDSLLAQFATTVCYGPLRPSTRPALHFHSFESQSLNCICAQDVNIVWKFRRRSPTSTMAESVAWIIRLMWFQWRKSNGELLWRSYEDPMEILFWSSELLIRKPFYKRFLALVLAASLLPCRSAL